VVLPLAARAAFEGCVRFDEFQDRLQISSSMLTSRLKGMVSAGLFERKQYQTNPPRYEYVLTALGRLVRPVLVSLAAWGNSRLAPAERSMILIDAETGEEEVRSNAERRTTTPAHTDLLPNALPAGWPNRTSLAPEPVPQGQTLQLRHDGLPPRRTS
jgi:DNA-binding HxlR family transcriptional regulator